MRKTFTIAAVLIFLAVAVLGTIRVARGQVPTNSRGEQILAQEVVGDAVREISAPADASPDNNQINIGFIDSPSATCYQPDPRQDVCYINWYYMSVSATPSYMLYMTVMINELGNVSRTQGFFQTSMYVPFSMLGDGFKVSCGALGAGGDPEWGKAYAYTIRARDSAALSAANYGTAYCPAYTP